MSFVRTLVLVAAFAFLLARAGHYEQAAHASGEPQATGLVAPRLAGRITGELASPVDSSGRVSPSSAARPDSSWSRASSIRAIRSVFGSNARAVKVADCESSLKPRTVSRTDDWGLFALHRSVWDPARNKRAKPYWPRGKDWSDVFDPVVNARVAWAISKRGTDFWTHWRWSARCWA